MMAQSTPDPQESALVASDPQGEPAQDPGTENAGGAQDQTTPSRADGIPVAVLIADLAALALILAALVAIVLFGNASAAVVSAVGAAISLAFRAWRTRAAA